MKKRLRRPNTRLHQSQDAKKKQSLVSKIWDRGKIPIIVFSIVAYSTLAFFLVRFWLNNRDKVISAGAKKTVIEELRSEVKGNKPLETKEAPEIKNRSTDIVAPSNW